MVTNKKLEYIATNYKSKFVEAFLSDHSKYGMQISFSKEKKPLGTAGALGLLDKSHELPLIVMNGDLLTKLNFRSLLEFHEHYDALITMCVREYDFQVPY